MMPVRRRAVVVPALGLGLLFSSPSSPAVAATARLTAFDSCPALVRYARAGATRIYGTAGRPESVRPGAPVPLDDSAPTLTAAPSPAAGGEEKSTAGTTFSTTNVQEAGIDEADIVKTDGRRIVTVSGDRLRIVDVAGAAPRLVGTLDLGTVEDRQLLLRGDRLLVLATSYGGGDVLPVGAVAQASLVPVGGTPVTTLTEIDLGDPSAPRVARTMTLDGAMVDARLTEGTARIVIRSTPLAGPTPLSRASLRAFVPATTIRSRITGRTYRRGVVGCGAVRHPRAFSGLDLLTVLTVDLDKGLYNVDRDAILAGAETVYASARNLYVASQRYVAGLDDTAAVPDGLRTEIHRFDASVPGVTTYAGSGSVPGFVVNQFALSEEGEHLRVATTDEPSWLPDGGEARPAVSAVTVLRTTGPTLTPVGRVGGLGAGERIFAVRFVGTTGYVVTFRQVDPLFTLDLSDPAAPRLVGELKLPGYSAYLHPVGDGLLLGIGQEADAQGRVEGTQVSLFDVSDLAHPRRVQHAVYGSGSSAAEFDHHAFLWWAPTGLAVLPLQTPGAASTDPGFTGVVGLHIARDDLREVGRVVHGTPAEAIPVDRSLVVGDRLYTVSTLGIAASTLDTLTPVAFVSYSL